MTGEEWDTSADAFQMLRAVRGLMSDRKLRLLGVACCRLFSGGLLTPVNRAAVETNERFADGRASLDELGRARVAVGTASDPGTVRQQSLVLFTTNEPARLRTEEMTMLGRYPALARSGPHLLRDVFGNPLRPVVFDPRWRTADAVGLALGIYEDREFNRLPLLMDALMDAGCDDEQVLGHCRSKGPHVRGCHVVDLVLGKQ